MIPAQNENVDRWNAVIARALCFISLDTNGLAEKPMVARAKHLEGLGLTRKEAAELLGTTAPSLTEQYRQQKQKKGGKRGKKR